MSNQIETLPKKRNNPVVAHFGNPSPLIPLPLIKGGETGVGLK
jgi:hypothetical protein